MDKKKKKIIGPGGQQILSPKPVECFSRADREFIIQEYLSSSVSKNALWKKYTGKQDHGRLLDWMCQLGYDPTLKKKGTTFVVTQPKMELTDKIGKKGQKLEVEKPIEELPKEAMQASLVVLKEELKLAKKALEEEKMRVLAYSTMIDIAEKEFNIPIRKKSDTKP
jgi:transposase